MWFKKLTGFDEINPHQVRQHLILKDDLLFSKANRKQWQYGSLSVPTLGELKKTAPSLKNYQSQIKVSECIGDVKILHQVAENNGALFQAASQFNLLEMVSPTVCPEEGIDIYENDYTQGPACAITCGAGTIYRNYFANVNGHIGQTSRNQIDCLSELALALGNSTLDLWQMSNGYALLTPKGLQNINTQILSKNPLEYQQLQEKLKIGIQWDTAVTLPNNSNIVTQAYCSALPIGYSNIPTQDWKPFANLILEATYLATFYAALINYEKTKNNRVFLTLVGGGVFRNKKEWILDAIQKAVQQFEKTPLDIRIVRFS